MPYKRPGEFYYATNTSGGYIQHGEPVVANGVVGIAVKQRATAWDAALTAHDRIADDEEFGIIVKGIVQVDNVSGFAAGDPVYLDDTGTVTDGKTSYPLSETSTGNLKFGRVVEVVNDGRGVPTGKVRINLDMKDSF